MGKHITLTRLQREAAKHVHDRIVAHEQQSGNAGPTYREFRRTFQKGIGLGQCVLVPYFDFWLGIEGDGYTHS